MLLTIFSLIVLLLSVALHEVAHGFLAYRLGDPTAKYAGRLTLNPLKHLDPIGSFFFPLFTLIMTAGRGPIFGWAKPVPINPYNFRDQRWGELKVAAAGPTINFVIALFFGILIRFATLPNLVVELFSIVCLYNIFWGIFNLLPVPPLDGSHIFFSLFPREAEKMRFVFRQYSPLILLIIVFFGLSFIEPLALKIFRLIVG
jgi:Zn-dependent protease